MIIFSNKLKSSQVLKSFRIFLLLNKSDRFYYCFTLFLSVFTGIFELLSLLFVSTFIASISTQAQSKPFIGDSNYIFEVSRLSLRLNFSESILLLMLVFVISYMSKFLSVLFANKASARSGNSIASDLFDLFFKQDYLSIVSINSNILTANAVSHVSGLITIINFQLQLISSLILSLFVLAAILSLYPAESFAILLVLVSLYLIYYFAFRRRLRSNSEIVARGNESLFKILQESKSSFRDLLINDYMAHSAFIF